MANAKHAQSCRATLNDSLLKTFDTTSVAPAIKAKFDTAVAMVSRRVQALAE